MTPFDDISDFIMKSLPAAIGGALSIKWRRKDPNKSDWRNVIESTFFAVGGYTISLFVIPVLEIHNHKVEQAALFGAGLIGMNIVNELYDEVMPMIANFIKAKIKKILK